MKSKTYLILFSLCLTFLACENVEVKRNLFYLPDQRASHSFDIYQPKNELQNRPALIAIHGGAWMSGDKEWGKRIGEEFAPLGYVVFSVNYRLSTEADGVWPAQINDLQAFVRYIKQNAREFRINPDKIASIGVSAGGHLAAMLALRDDPLGNGRVKVAAPLDGEHDMTLPGEECMADFDNIMTHVLGHPKPWSEAELKDISTVFRARPDVAFFIVHGERDPNVYVKNGDLLNTALKKAKARVEYVRIAGEEGDCHSSCWKKAEARKWLHEFMDRNLK